MSKAAKYKHPKAVFSIRHHILPPVFGLLIFAGILGLFNNQYLVAQFQYRFSTPASAAELPDGSITDSASVSMYIPKINLQAPVVYDEPSYLESDVQLALRRGVVHYGTTALPGQAGNIVVLGHSSGQAWTPGEYKFVFTLLDKLETGDRIFVDYEGTRYIYRVKGIKTVSPSDLSVVQPTREPQLTLITCTPVGTDKYRLVITATQVSPQPSTATPIDAKDVKPVTSWAIPR